MTLPELIASEVMNAIERERRINKDDLIMAAEVAIGKFKKEQERASPLMVATPTDESLQNILTQQAMVDAVKEYMRIDSQKCGGFEFYVNEPIQTGVSKPGCISSAEAAQKAAYIYHEGYNYRAAEPFYGKSLPNMVDEARQRLIAKQQQAAALREYQGVQIVNDRRSTVATYALNADGTVSFVCGD